MVIDFCLKPTPTYDVINLLVAFNSLPKEPHLMNCQRTVKPSFYSAADRSGRQKSQYICRRDYQL